MHFRTLSALLLLLFAPAAFAVEVSALSPTSGPSAGGTEVLIMGNFPVGPYSVVFGGIPATSLEKIDAHTLKAVTPAHLPGDSTVVVREGEQLFGALLDFEFKGGVPDAFERILLPILTPPARGSFGSEFRTTFTAWNASSSGTLVFGLEQSCPICGGFPPIPPEALIDIPLLVLSHGTLDSPLGSIIYSGSPGRFIYVRADDAKKLATGLRVHDTSRAALNLGTEIPVVHAREFVTTETLAMTNVPVDSRFRNTLRIYGTAETNVTVTFLGGFPPGFIHSERVVHLQPGKHLFEPAYAQVSDFPSFASSTVPLTVTVTSDSGTAVWAFVSVTNNETQAITTISPQR
ncbi:MAG TPA: IPT/TIG domain-containing protein [Thermoanaerobaculia bacterium]|nr:IPT/TIG domain-containing protein [Thermoanaerobaculia bacterium]